MPNTFIEVRTILKSCLQLDSAADSFTAATPLMGALPEFDSMTVVSLLTDLEDYYGFIVEDDEISAELFVNLGNLVAYVEQKKKA